MINEIFHKLSGLNYHVSVFQAMWLMLQQEKPEDFVISMHESHSVREFVVLAFKKVNLDVE